MIFFWVICDVVCFMNFVFYVVVQSDVYDDEFSNYKEVLIEEKFERDYFLVDEIDCYWE